MKYTDQVRSLQEVIHSEMIEYIKQYGYDCDIHGKECVFIKLSIKNSICTITGEKVVGFFVTKGHTQLMYSTRLESNHLATELYLIQVANTLDVLLKRAKLSLQPSLDLAMKILNAKMSTSLTKVQVCELVRVINGLNDYQYALLITMVDEATS